MYMYVPPCHSYRDRVVVTLLLRQSIVPLAGVAPLASHSSQRGSGDKVTTTSASAHLGSNAATITAKIHCATQNSHSFSDNDNVIKPYEYAPRGEEGAAGQRVRETRMARPDS